MVSRSPRVPVPRRRAKPPGGFTLVEMLVVVGVAGILTALSLNALGSVRRRADYSSASNELVLLLKRLRNEAFSRSTTTVLVVVPGSRLALAIEDKNGDFDLSTFDLANPTPAPDRLLAKMELPPSVAFGPATGFGGALPAPFSGVPASQACTFCGSIRGAIRFQADGTALISPPISSDPNPEAGSFSLEHTATGQRKTVAVVARTGTVQVYDQ